MVYREIRRRYRLKKGSYPVLENQDEGKIIHPRQNG